MLKLHTPMPSLSGAVTWLNSPPLDAARLVGAPVLVHFWALGCSLCKQQLPTVHQWRHELEARGLRFIGVHTPVEGTPAGTGAEQVAKAARSLGLTYPIAVDSQSQLARAFQVTATPAYFVFDAAGRLRHHHAGHGAEATTRAALERVLREQEHAHPPAG